MTSTIAEDPAAPGSAEGSRPRLVVLGGGPAGDVAALRGAQLGADVVLVERDNLGGTCLNWGCIPTKALLAAADLVRRIRTAAEYGIDTGPVRVDLPRMMARKEQPVLAMRKGVEAACQRRRVRVVRESGVVEDGGVRAGGEVYPYDHLIVCTGTAASGLPGLDLSDPRVMTSDGVLRLEVLPERLLVVGGGVVGCEFASFFAALGTRVTVVEVLPQILAGVEPRVVTQFRRLVEREGVTFLTGRRVASLRNGDGAEAGGLRAVLDDGTEIATDLVLVSVGRLPLTRGIGLEERGVALDHRGHVVVDGMLRTANPRIWAAGDCIGGLQLAHLASKEAERAVENALGHRPRPIDRSVVPACIYTHPEIAMVGLNTVTAAAAGYEVKVGQARYAGNGKALGEGQADGLVQIYADAGTDVLIGATIMGAHAVEIIHEVAVALSDGLTLAELGDVVHAHPTVSELVMDAAQQAEKVAPYLS